ncbi:MAG: hypothetical protein DMF84_06405 [Acidobacteria bacterium]|nr:MAG: hypothetical protein DMF84_06405 [Acidobacteriota bacterium]
MKETSHAEEYQQYRDKDSDIGSRHGAGGNDGAASVTPRYEAVVGWMSGIVRATIAWWISTATW